MSTDETRRRDDRPRGRSVRPLSNRLTFRAVVIAGWLGGSLMTALMLLSLRASADGSPYTDDLPRLLAYQGHLARGGEGYNGDLDMTFAIYASTTSSTPLWEEEQTVTASRGAFSVFLGATAAEKAAALEPLFVGGAPLYVGVSLRTPSGTEVALAGRKAILPLPYAVVSTAMIGDAALDEPLELVGDSTTTDTATGPLALVDGNGHHGAIDGDTIASDQVYRINWVSDQPVEVHGGVTMTGGSLTGRSGDGILSVTEDEGRLTVDAGDYHDDVSDSSHIYVYGAASFTGEWVDATDGGWGSGAFETDIGFDNCTWVNLYEKDGDALLNELCSNARVVTGVVLNGTVSAAKAIEQIKCCSAKLTVR